MLVTVLLAQGQQVPMKIAIHVNRETHLFREQDDLNSYIQLLRDEVQQSWPQAEVFAAVSEHSDLIAVAGFSDNEAVKSRIYLMKSALWEQGSWVMG